MLFMMLESIEWVIWGLPADNKKVFKLVWKEYNQSRDIPWLYSFYYIELLFTLENED